MRIKVPVSLPGVTLEQLFELWVDMLDIRMHVNGGFDFESCLQERLEYDHRHRRIGRRGEYDDIAN